LSGRYWGGRGKRRPYGEEIIHRGGWEESDLIFVLAGRLVRKRFALELFRSGAAPRLLFSVARFEVRGFRELALPVALDLLPIAQQIPAPERHFFVLFGEGEPLVERIAVRRFGTLREIEALSAYLTRRREIRSLIVVTSVVHARRVGLCCRVLLPRDVKFQMVAVPRLRTGGSDVNVAEPRASLVESVTELVKLGVYRAMLTVRGRPRSQD
jgi:hypothetical protein